MIVSIPHNISASLERREHHVSANIFFQVAVASRLCTFIASVFPKLDSSGKDWIKRIQVAHGLRGETTIYAASFLIFSMKKR
jgi:hypothetical protein